MASARRMLPFLLLIGIAAGLRVTLAQRQGLWADELFSLAMATGHSLEHPAATADSAFGDFVQGPAAQPAAAWRRYLEHEHPPASPARVLRAVKLSDTSPPLYYLLLAWWTTALGTSDFAVRCFSVLWAVATFPLLWRIGRSFGGTRAAISTGLLFALAPVSLYYSVEARMYSLVWFLAALLGWFTLRLPEQNASTRTAVGWVLAGTAGLLTHYFFAFVWLACVAWLLVYPGWASRGRVLAAALATIALVLPWYLHVPESLARWRVTGHWLEGPLSAAQMVSAPFVLAWNLLSGRGPWGGIRSIDRAGAGVLFLVGVLLALAGPGELFTRRKRLLWIWLAAACTGPLVFDLLRGTFTSQIPRYALAGMPAAMLLAGFAFSLLRPALNTLLLLAFICAWIPGIRTVFENRSHSWEPYREVAAEVAREVHPGDLVIVHSIPSGVLGIARYLDPQVPVAAWVEQLGERRVPDDLDSLLRGHTGVALVTVHDVGAPAPEADWLRAHATLRRETRRESARVAYFSPRDAATFDTGPPLAGPPATRR